MDEQTKLGFNQFVQLQLDSGIPPLEPIFYPIVPVDGNEAFAVRSSTTVHSIIMGDMKQDDYIAVSDVRLVGIELFRHNIQHAITTLRAFDKAHKRCDFVAVRCPVQVFERTSIYEIVKDILEHNPSVNPKRLCIEFPEIIVERDVKRCREAVLDMQLLKLRTAISGVGKEDFKVSKLVSIPVNYAFIDVEATKWAGDRNKPQLFSSLLSYIKAMGAESLVLGKEEIRKELRFTDTVGFMAEGSDPIKLEEALALAEEVLD